MSLSRFGGALLLSLAFSLPAATMKLASLKVGSTTYTDVHVLGANATDLYFTHDLGIANVKLKYLGADLQKRFHYDAKAAADAEKAQAEADALYQSTVISSMAAEAKILADRNKAAKLQEPLLDPISDKSLVGKAAPPLDLKNWVGEKPSTEGKYVLLSFWAPWSAASRQCIPELNALQKKFEDKLAVIGVTPPSEANPEIADLKLEFASATDAQAKTSAAAAIRNIPAVLLIDSKGVVRYEGHPAGITEKKLQMLFAEPTE